MSVRAGLGWAALAPGWDGPRWQFEVCSADVESARTDLVALGFAKTADSEKSSELASRLQKAGPAKVDGLLRKLRECDGLSLPGYPTLTEIKEHQSRAAAPIAAALTELGFEKEASNVRPAARAHGSALVPSPAGAFLNVGAAS